MRKVIILILSLTLVFPVQPLSAQLQAEMWYITLKPILKMALP